MNQGPFLVIPGFEKGCGGGHLIRSLVLVRALRSQNKEAYLYIPEFGKGENFEGRVFSCKNEIDHSWLIPDKQSLRTFPWDCIVLDRFKTSPEEYIQWSALAPLIGIDEGGMFRDTFDFLMDLLPGPPKASPPNIIAPHLLPLPKNRRFSFDSDPSGQPLKILVSFGAEDPGGLTIPVCLALASSENQEITALFGGLNRLGDRAQKIAGVRVLETVPELREHLAEYDLVITHFGLTAFECIYARVPVILVSPGAYHEKLARHAGFISAGIGKRGVARLKNLLYKIKKTPISRESSSINYAFLSCLGECGEKIGLRYGLNVKKEQAPSPQSLGELLGSYIPHFPLSCPACSSQDRFHHPVLARFSDRTYRRCSRCGIVYMLRPSPPPIEYAEAYFFDFYKKQYGITYLEDFQNLIKNGKRRLKYITALLLSQQGGDPLLLDIGCAYGPFLAAAREEGFTPIGMDPAKNAVRYVEDELRIAAFHGFFPDTPLPDILKHETFEAVSLWYVIEHFKDPCAALRKIHQLLKPGGVLAFSTPSCSGVSGRISVKGFLEKSPPDHWTIWEPRYTRKILKLWGFKLKKIVVSGHHPERFPIAGRFLTRKQGILYTFCLWISRIFRLGDTFEVYAVRCPTK